MYRTLLLLVLLVVGMVHAQQFWHNRGPPSGARVEVEYEYVEPPSAGASGAAGGSSQSPMSTTPAPIAMQGGGSQYTQTYLTNLLNMALNMRTMTRSTTPLPLMDEPCPCDADCCLLPIQPRRVIPVMHLSMTMHAGCCGCIECPVSMSPMVVAGLRFVKRLDRQFGTPAAPQR